VLLLYLTLVLLFFFFNYILTIESNIVTLTDISNKSNIHLINRSNVHNRCSQLQNWGWCRIL